jgi:hypothetical protein
MCEMATSLSSNSLCRTWLVEDWDFWFSRKKHCLNSVNDWKRLVWIGFLIDDLICCMPSSDSTIHCDCDTYYTWGFGCCINSCFEIGFIVTRFVVHVLHQKSCIDNQIRVVTLTVSSCARLIVFQSQNELLPALSKYLWLKYFKECSSNRDFTAILKI